MKKVRPHPTYIATAWKKIHEQDHDLPSISYVLLDDENEVFGAFCDEFTPLCFVWMDQERWNPLAAFRAWRLIESHWESHLKRKILIAINEESPFYPWAKRAGFKTLGAYELMEKQLIQN